MTLLTRNNPSLAEAQQAVPAGFLSPALKLQSPPPGKPVPESDDEVVPQEHERPRGRILLYWGCGASVRSGQPLTLDAASASAADFARFFQSRRATQRGTHSAAGRPVWPSKSDTRMVPAAASLAGEHTFTGTRRARGLQVPDPAAAGSDARTRICNRLTTPARPTCAGPQHPPRAPISPPRWVPARRKR